MTAARGCQKGILAGLLLSILGVPGTTVAQERPRTRYEQEIGEELTVQILETMRTFRETIHSPRTLQEALENHLSSLPGVVVLKGWHVTGEFDGCYLVEYRWVVDGVPAGWVYELDLEAGTIRTHSQAKMDREETVLIGLLVWSLWMGFEFLVYCCFWILLFGLGWGVLQHPGRARKERATPFPSWLGTRWRRERRVASVSRSATLPSRLAPSRP